MVITALEKAPVSPNDLMRQFLIFQCQPQAVLTMPLNCEDLIGNNSAGKYLGEKCATKPDWAGLEWPCQQVLLSDDATLALSPLLVVRAV